MKIMTGILLVLSLNLFAHDEGHGPKLTDAPKQGGMVTSVVLAKEASLGPKAVLIYKAEIVRSADGLVRIYFYDKTMKPLITSTLAKVSQAVLITSKKGKFTTKKFELKWVEDHFEGTMPKPDRKPYSVDMRLMDGEKELLAAFDNLD